MLHTLSPAVNTVHVAHGTTSFFSRTQQFPGECGHGQDPEDHGSPAEPLHGVSVLSVAHIQLYMKQWALSSYVCALSSLPCPCKYFNFTEIENLCCVRASSHPIRITTTINSTPTYSCKKRCLLPAGQSDLQHVRDTWLTAGCPSRSCNPHTFRINLLQRWLALTIAGHLVKNASGSTVGAAHLCLPD